MVIITNLGLVDSGSIPLIEKLLKQIVLKVKTLNFKFKFDRSSRSLLDIDKALIV